jgi:hypothetical protein
LAAVMVPEDALGRRRFGTPFGDDGFLGALPARLLPELHRRHLHYRGPASLLIGLEWAACGLRATPTTRDGFRWAADAIDPLPDMLAVVAAATSEVLCFGASESLKQTEGWVGLGERVVLDQLS